MINKFQQIKQKLNNINEIYIDYFLCVSFLTLILFKINNLFFQISLLYLYPSIIILVILFIKQWLYITDILKNTYFFNFFLYYFLMKKNNFYQSIFYYFDYAENEKNTNLIIFLTGFVLSSWTLNIFFFIINNSYNLSIIMFFFLLLLNIFNLIEKKLIFNEKNLRNYNQEIDYNQVQHFLKIKNKKFQKNHSLFYIQKRYMHFNEFKNLIKKHGITIISSATAGTLFTSAIHIKSVNIQQKQFDFMQIQHKEQIEIQKGQMDIQKEQMDIQKEQIQIQKKKNLDDFLMNYNEKIRDANHLEYKLQKDMDSRYFWDKMNLSDTLNNLKEEKNYLKRKRAEAEKEAEIEKQRDSFSFEEMKTNIDKENLNITKKQKLDDDFFFDE